VGAAVLARYLCADLLRSRVKTWSTDGRGRPSVRGAIRLRGAGVRPRVLTASLEVVAHRQRNRSASASPSLGSVLAVCLRSGGGCQRDGFRPGAGDDDADWHGHIAADYRSVTIARNCNCGPSSVAVVPVQWCRQARQRAVNPRCATCESDVVSSGRSRSVPPQLCVPGLGATRSPRYTGRR
jgi:hypothetical protein